MFFEGVILDLYYNGVTIPDIFVIQKQPFRGVLRKRCSKNVQQIHKRTPMSKCDFSKVAKHEYYAVNLMYICGTFFHNNVSGGLLLII